MKKYHQLTLAEREKLYCLNDQGLSLRKIAEQLGRDHSSLSRELARNSRSLQGNPSGVKDYLPVRANRKAVKRKIKQRTNGPLKNPAVFLYVREHLRPPYSWTPEQVAGRLHLDLPKETIDDDTIYRYIYSKKAACFKLWQYLPLGRKKRMKKLGRRPKRQGKIPGAASIDLRPKEIETRKKIGHWESDNVVGKQKDKTVVSVSVERKVKYTLLSKLDSKTASAKLAALVQRLSQFPNSARLTLTVDNGSENSYHQQVSKELGLNVYFCHSYHSWEKGTVENTNGRIRRYLPKGISLDNLTEAELTEIERRLNNTPRKCLGFKTPREALLEALT